MDASGLDFVAPASGALAVKPKELSVNLLSHVGSDLVVHSLKESNILFVIDNHLFNSRSVSLQDSQPQSSRRWLFPANLKKLSEVVKIVGIKQKPFAGHFKCIDL